MRGLCAPVRGSASTTRDKTGARAPWTARWCGHSQRCAPIRGPARVAGAASAREARGDTRRDPAPRYAHRCVARRTLAVWTRVRRWCSAPWSRSFALPSRPCAPVRAPARGPGSLAVHGPGSAGTSHSGAPVRGLAPGRRDVAGPNGPLAALWRTCSRSGSPVRSEARPGGRTDAQAAPMELPRMDAPRLRSRLAAVRTASSGLRTGTKGHPKARRFAQAIVLTAPLRRLGPQRDPATMRPHHPP